MLALQQRVSHLLNQESETQRRAGAAWRFAQERLYKAVYEKEDQMRARSQRAWLIAVAGALLAGAAALVFSSLGDNLNYTRTPTEMVEGSVSPGTRVRVGGLVGVDSIVRDQGSTTLFAITDGVYDVNVSYDGLTPDLFEEGQGIVAEGVVLADGSVSATRLVARHDENYMPKEAYDALKEAGGDAAEDASSYHVNQNKAAAE